MATAAPASPVLNAEPPWRPAAPAAGEGNSFLWHKLHSLSGIVPIGAFLVEHIVSNFETWNGPVALPPSRCSSLNSLPLVRVLEWAFIFIPLAFHALYGVFIIFRGRSNTNVYPWAGNRMYLMQRITGMIAFVYIIQHVWRQRFAGVRPAREPRRCLPQGAGRALQPLDAGRLRHRHDRYHLALQLRHLALRPPSGASPPAKRPARSSATSAPPSEQPSASWTYQHLLPSSTSIPMLRRMPCPKHRQPSSNPHPAAPQ